MRGRPYACALAVAAALLLSPWAAEAARPGAPAVDPCAPGDATRPDIGRCFDAVAGLGTGNTGGVIGIESLFEAGFILKGGIATRQFDLDSPHILRFGDIKRLRPGAFATGGADTLGLGLPVTPDLSAGLGSAPVVANDVRASASSVVDDGEWVTVMQPGAGDRIRERWTLDVGYRFFLTADAEFEDAAGDAFDSGFMSHDVLFGAGDAF